MGNAIGRNRSADRAWAINLSVEEYEQNIGRYAFAVAERYSTDLNYYALENEPNSFHMHLLNGWRSNRWSEERIFSTIGALENGIREGDPEGVIALSVAFTTGWLGWIERAGEQVSYDLLAVNAYKSPAVISYIVRKMREMDLDVIISETGLSTADRSEGEQADLVRDSILAARQSRAKGIFIYQYRDNPEEMNKKERFFGLIRSDGSEKMAFQEYSNAVETIKNGPSITSSELGFKDRLSILIFESEFFSGVIDSYLNLFVKFCMEHPRLRDLYLRLMDTSWFSSMANPLRY